jgi:hypothetical protein
MATALGRPGAQCTRPAGPASACAARDGAVRRESACRSGHRSPGACRGVAGGGATAAEVEQTAPLEDPRRRGYPSGMGVEAIANRSSSSTGRGRKTGSAAAFSDEVRAPVAGGSPAMGRRKRELSSMFHGRKAARRGSGSAHRGGARDGGGGRTMTVARSDSIGRLWTRTTVQSGRARVRRGDGAAQTAAARSGRLSGRWGAVSTAHLRRASGVAQRGRVAATRQRCTDRQARRGKRRLKGGPHSSAFFELNLLLEENRSKINS